MNLEKKKQFKDGLVKNLESKIGVLQDEIKRLEGEKDKNIEKLEEETEQLEIQKAALSKFVIKT